MPSLLPLLRCNHRPVRDELIWDGACGFCKFWITRWQRITGDALSYRTYQEAYSDYSDVGVENFKRAVQLITSEGWVYSGAHAVFKTLTYSKSSRWLRMYERVHFIRMLCDVLYGWIASHRPLAMRMTLILFGNNPLDLSHRWAVFLVLLLLVLGSLIFTLFF